MVTPQYLSFIDWAWLLHNYFILMYIQIIIFVSVISFNPFRVSLYSLMCCCLELYSGLVKEKNIVTKVIKYKNVLSCWAFQRVRTSENKWPNSDQRVTLFPLPPRQLPPSLLTPRQWKEQEVLKLCKGEFPGQNLELVESISSFFTFFYW